MNSQDEHRRPMLFRRTTGLFAFIAMILLARLFVPNAENWPTVYWVAPLLFAFFIVGPFLVAQDVKEGREVAGQDITKTAGQ